jgi:hypothetical protein
MFSKNLADRARTVALTICLVAPSVFINGRAEARNWGKDYYSQTFETDRPVKGYEGFLFPDYYCSYKRHPKRVCSNDKRGRQTCRITAWTLEQTCQ